MLEAKRIHFFLTKDYEEVKEEIEAHLNLKKAIIKDNKTHECGNKFEQIENFTKEINPSQTIDFNILKLSAVFFVESDPSFIYFDNYIKSSPEEFQKKEDMLNEGYDFPIYRFLFDKEGLGKGTFNFLTTISQSNTALSDDNITSPLLNITKNTNFANYKLTLKDNLKSQMMVALVDETKGNRVLGVMKIFSEWKEPLFAFKRNEVVSMIKETAKQLSIIQGKDKLKGQLFFLLGAGASLEAKIPTSNEMVKKIEDCFTTGKKKDVKKWKDVEGLFNFLKSCIIYSEGIFGQFGQFNVEKLLIVMAEIEKKDKNIMYPFIGAWNIRLFDQAGENFDKLKKLNGLIRGKLKEWLEIEYLDAKYYEGFRVLQSQMDDPLKIFTLNYDLCFEKVVGNNIFTVETGFNKNNMVWNQHNFENTDNKHFLLFKLHGSINWEFEEKQLVEKNDPIDNAELIFGVQHKMTSNDPYLYYASKLREACIGNIRLIVVVGYSFADEYVNIILSQGLKRKNVRLLCVGPEKGEKEKERIANNLSLESMDQIIFVNMGAKEFFTKHLNIEYFKSQIKHQDSD
ncbi:SIR2 family protein [Chondrinema litorale]|uniref:SIR2 family protein n=1 Tax=Chondrinema litorale TaxID=2994555 RepID=UPI002543BB45|nr:SIR2 family protein [Chondrinema litorale]UZR97137.1 SIR2 family protein [Chondrinema litorale]